MKIVFELEEHEAYVTPILIVNALVSDPGIKPSRAQLSELIAYLSVYTSYNKEDEGERIGR